MAAKKSQKKTRGTPKPAGDRLLSVRMQAFVDAYTGPAEGVGWRACEMAGYSGGRNTLEVQASRLLKNARVVQAIREATAEVRSQVVADRAERQRLYTEFLRGEVEEEVVVVVAEGDFCSRAEKVKKRVDGRTRLKAAELLGKVQGDFIERIEVRAGEAFRDRFQALQKAMGQEAWTFDKFLTFFAEGE